MIFRELAKGQKVGLILNALDNLPKARDDWSSSQSLDLAALGLDAHELDLRNYFGKSSHLEATLDDLDALWINGGNAFILRRAMRQSGFDSVIKAMLNEDRIAYGGFSAAAVVLHESLKSLELVDDPNDVPEGYFKEPIWDGLGILPFAIVVHYRSNHSEAEAVEGELQHYRQNGTPYRTLRDGQALVVDGDVDTARIVGASPL